MNDNDDEIKNSKEKNEKNGSTEITTTKLLKIMTDQFKQASVGKFTNDLQNFLNSDIVNKNLKPLKKEYEIINLIAGIGIFETLERIDLLNSKFNDLEVRIEKKVEKNFENIEILNSSLGKFLSIFDKGSKGIKAVNNSIESIKENTKVLETSIAEKIEELQNHFNIEFNKYQENFNNKIIDFQSTLESKVKELDDQTGGLNESLDSINENLQNFINKLLPEINDISNQFQEKFEELFQNSLEPIQKININISNLDKDSKNLKEQLIEYSETYFNSIKNKIREEAISNIINTYKLLQTEFSDYRSLVKNTSEHSEKIIKEFEKIEKIISDFMGKTDKIEEIIGKIDNLESKVTALEILKDIYNEPFKMGKSKNNNNNNNNK